VTGAIRRALCADGFNHSRCESFDIDRLRRAMQFAFERQQA